MDEMVGFSPSRNQHRRQEFVAALTSMELGLTRREINAIMFQVDQVRSEDLTIGRADHERDSRNIQRSSPADYSYNIQFKKMFGMKSYIFCFDLQGWSRMGYRHTTLITMWLKEAMKWKVRRSPRCGDVLVCLSHWVKDMRGIPCLFPKPLRVNNGRGYTTYTLCSSQMMKSIHKEPCMAGYWLSFNHMDYSDNPSIGNFGKHEETRASLGDLPSINVLTNAHTIVDGKRAHMSPQIFPVFCHQKYLLDGLEHDF